MLAAGVNVALATDSLASNPDLNPLNDARFLHHHDHTSPHTLLQMITANAARALGLSALTGSLSPGKSADLVSFPLAPAPDPLTTLLQSPATRAALYLAGVRVR
jgi:5-methylthioadenosine/S-adenosylhomocysteine deaminase